MDPPLTYAPSLLLPFYHLHSPKRSHTPAQSISHRSVADHRRPPILRRKIHNHDSSNQYMEHSSNGYIYKSASFAASSQRDVTYRCGCCGYDLNLSSSARNTSSIGSKYGKSIKTGMISFFCIDETRFNQVDDFRCVQLPYFISKHLWRRKTKLLCRKCNNHIGNAYDDKSYPPLVSDLASPGDVSSYRKYDVRIRALQPSSSLESSFPLVV